MLYFPAGIFGSVKRPWPSLVADRVKPLPVAITVALGTTAAEGSVTVPRIEAALCAFTSCETTPTSASAASVNHNVLTFICICLSGPVFVETKGIFDCYLLLQM